MGGTEIRTGNAGKVVMPSEHRHILATYHSAASHAFIPRSLWKTAKNHLMTILSETKTGTERDFTNAVNAVIDEPSFDCIMSYIRLAQPSSSAEIIAGGKGDKSTGNPYPGYGFQVSIHGKVISLSYPPAG